MSRQERQKSDIHEPEASGITSGNGNLSQCDSDKDLMPTAPGRDVSGHVDVRDGAEQADIYSPSAVKTRHQRESGMNFEQNCEILQQELERTRKCIQRLESDLMSFRNRVRKERQELSKYGSIPILQQLLPIVDNFDRAIEAMIDSTDTETLEGVKLIRRQLLDFLRNQGCQRMDAVGKSFDPQLHEAVRFVPSEDYSSGAILSVEQHGYQLHDRLVRPARVVVSSGIADIPNEHDVTREHGTD